VRDQDTLDNLRVVSHQENCVNKHGYRGIPFEFRKDLPDDAVVIEAYKGRALAPDYYEWNGDFWRDIGVGFRKLRVSHHKSGSKTIGLHYANNQPCCATYSILRDECGLND
jgi:hypothetical protein